MPEVPKTGLRIAIYARVSTEEQREGQTIDSQVAELERFCREKVWLIAGIYKDEGWSGGIMERPEPDRHLRPRLYRGTAGRADHRLPSRRTRSLLPREGLADRRHIQGCGLERRRHGAARPRPS